MRRLILVGAVLTAVLVATPARAQVTLGARVGYGLGLGDAGGSLAMADWVRTQIPLQVDALYRVSSRLSLGLYFSHGFASAGGDLADACDLPGGDCSAWVRRFGVQASYAFGRWGRAAPWAGAGVGYEWNRLEASDPAGDVAVTLEGWEYLNLQGGADVEVASRLSVGPFVLFSVSQYGEGELSGAFGEGGGPVEGKEMHAWLILGIRGRLDL